MVQTAHLLFSTGGKCMNDSTPKEPRVQTATPTPRLYRRYRLDH